MISIRKNIRYFAILFVLVLVVLVFISFGDSNLINHTSLGRVDHENIALEDVTPEFIHEEDGEIYYIVDGNFYILKNGKLEFLENLYDLDFYEKNYLVEGNSIFQIDPENGDRHAVVTHFEEGFENAGNLEDLFTLYRWHNSNVNPKYAGEYGNYYNIGNRVAISNDIVHSGSNSLRAFANPWTDVSKASIGRNLMYFAKGDDIYISSWFYMEDTPDIVDGGGMTFFDIESSWMNSLGIRSIIKSGDALAVELKFLGKKTFRQETGKEIAFPIEKWVHVETHIYLSDEDGFVEMWQDGVKIIEERGRTLPLANTVLDKLELGISAIAANAKYEKALYIDDFIISNKPIR